MTVVWITGVPSTGKSTLATAVIDRLRRRGCATLWLDSDDLREVLTPSPEYTDAERDWFYGAIAHLALRAEQGGVTVVISATAQKREYRDRARRVVEQFVEVHLTCDERILRARDTKGLYRGAAAGEITTLPGVGAAYEAPLQAELTFDSGAMAPEEMARAVLDRIEKGSVPMKKTKRFLVPIDFAECSRKGLEVALSLAQVEGAEVDVFHVWYVADFAAPDLPIAVPSGRVMSLDEVAQREAKSQMAAFLSGVTVPEGVKLTTSIIFGVPSGAILERAKDYDLVVMGTHGRRGLAHVLLGSVTEKVMRECTRPVLVVNGR